MSEVDKLKPMTDEEALDSAMAERVAGKVVDHAWQVLAGQRRAIIGALETENAQHINAIECLRQELGDQKRAYQANFELQQRQVNELVLALMWCKPRLRHEAYQQHVTWTLAKYPKPLKPVEPPIVRSQNPDADYCPSDPRGPGRTGGE